MLKEPLCIDVRPGQELGDQRLTFNVHLLVLGVNISGQTCLLLVSSGLQALVYPKEGCT